MRRQVAIMVASNRRKRALARAGPSPAPPSRTHQVDEEDVLQQLFSGQRVRVLRQHALHHQPQVGAQVRHRLGAGAEAPRGRLLDQQLLFEGSHRWQAQIRVPLKRKNK